MKNLHPLLPTRGIFTPTRMIFNTQLPASVLVTWIQLRCLAWSGWETPPFSISELASLLGIHPERLTRHLAQLQEISALFCRLAEQEKLILSFPEESTDAQENPMETRDPSGPDLSTTGSQEPADTPSYFPQQILGYLTFEEDLDGFTDSHALEVIFSEQEKAIKC